MPTVWTDWTVNQVRAALRLHEEGDFSMSAILADHVMRDDRIFATLDSAVLGLLGLPFSIKPSEDVPIERAKLLADEASRWWWRAVPEAVAADIERCVKRMGFAVAETTYEAASNAEQLRPRVHVHHLQYVRWDHQDQRFYILTPNGLEPITPGDGRWMLFAPQGTNRPWMNGAIRAIAIPFLVRTFVRRDWARRSEIEGVGVRKAGIPENADPEVVNRFLRDVQQLGAETTIRLPPGYTFNVEAVQASAADSFQKLVDHCDSAITLAFLGQNMTTQIEGGGSYAAGTIHVGVLRARFAFGAATLSTTFREQLFMPWGRLNFPDWNDDAAPWPTWNTQAVEDLQAKGTALVALSQGLTSLKALGVDIRPELEKFDLKLLDEQTGKDPELRAYHLDAGLVTIDEARKLALKLGPLPNGEGAVRTSAVANSVPAANNNAQPDSTPAA